MLTRSHTPIGFAVSLFFAALLFGGSVGPTASSVAQQPGKGVVVETKGSLAGFAAVVRTAAPAVVNVSSSRIVRVPAIAMDSGVSEEFLRRYFNDESLAQMGPFRERRERSRGSGVIVSKDGYILTNYHMIEGAGETRIMLSDDREFVGKIVGSDPGTDIAILKINADQLPYIPLADSAKVQVGDLALAIGNPFGLGRTVTMGIVGATGRGGLGIEDYEDFIQTDASINPGNSGGALTNVRGELIGVNTAILSPSGVNLGIGFAVPSNLVRQVMNQIVKTGKVSRGFMGATVQDLTPNLAAALNLRLKKGALVGDVESDGPAAQGGLQPGDVIVELNKKPIKESRDVRLTLGAMQPGERVSMSVQRSGQPKAVAFVLAVEPVSETAVPFSLALADEAEPDVGIRVRDLTPEIRNRLHLPEALKGILVAEVADGSAAAEADLHPGDVIEEVNKKAVTTGEEFLAEAAKAKREPLLLRVNRGGHGLYVAMK
jgi:serine protease Do